ncbi:MAG: ATP-dependent DNA helicase RecG [Bacteroidales bacterium]|nr:ATP-dependent DNA helicase RecG [Bacteroidales bacterium]
MHYDPLSSSIEYVKGVGPKRAELLKKEVHITSFNDLMMYYPFRYADRSKIFTIKEISPSMPYVQLKGRIVAMQELGHKRSTRLVALLEDATGTVELVWFKGLKWIREKLAVGKIFIVYGKPSLFSGKINIPHPELETPESYEQLLGTTLQPFYSTTEKLRNIGLDSKGIAKIMRNLLASIKGNIPETLPSWLIKRYNIPRREEAIMNIHFPQDEQQLGLARKRLKFEELFYVQLGLLLAKHDRYKKSKGHIFSTVGDRFHHFYSQNLPFALTDAQKRVIKEIRSDLGKGTQMNRLLQGDVGSGKTLVALLTMLIANDNNFQVALMVPTEILASQHYKTIVALLNNIPVETRLLTGSTKAAKRKSLLQELEQGDINILIGTHALIEESVIFKNLGLVIIDEQHRFGVAQRAKMWGKSSVPPHILVMTATPIPRTLAMTLYGDLDVSVIDEMPPGRKPVKTFHLTDSKRLRLFAFMREQIALGRQIYVVYPLIEESEKLELKDLMDGYESLSRAFPLPDYAISIVHGRMKAEQKAYEMQRFIKNETQIMVSTTVIEVGVDIPNASVMVIENAERFGLSQLHQLRGRVGRGADQAYCVLMSGDKITHEGRKRLSIMVQSNNGFDIAEEDLAIRGPGDLQGTQQSGLLEFRIADIVRDEKIMVFARGIAEEIVQFDPELKDDKNVVIKRQMDELKKSRHEWIRIS